MTLGRFPQSWERCTRGYLGPVGVGGADTESTVFSLAGPAPACSGGQWGVQGQARHPWVSQVGTPGGGASDLSLPPPGWGREELPASPCHPAKCWPCLPQTFSRHPLGARPSGTACLAAGHWTPPPPASQRGQCLQDPQRPGPRGVHQPSAQLRPLPDFQARGWGGGQFLGHSAR